MPERLWLRLKKQRKQRDGGASLPEAGERSGFPLQSASANTIIGSPDGPPWCPADFHFNPWRKISGLRLALPAAVLLLLVFSSFRLFGDPLFSDSEGLMNQGRYLEARDSLEALYAQSDHPDIQAEASWRISRVIFLYAKRELGGDPGMEKKAALELLREAESYADQAISHNPRSAEAYFWRSACKGQYLELDFSFAVFSLTGSLRDDLVTAINLKPDYVMAYDVLSILYRQVPGWPLGFGDKNISVSLARTVVALGAGSNQETDHSRMQYLNSLVTLARVLYERNHSSGKRNRLFSKLSEKLDQAQSTAERAGYYEGRLVSRPHAFDFIPDMESLSDRQEAAYILSWVKSRLTQGPLDPDLQTLLIKVEQLILEQK